MLIVTIAMTMINGRLGEDKQNNQEKNESAVRSSVAVVPLALPLMAGPGAISSCIVWSSRWEGVTNFLGLAATSIFLLFVAGYCFVVPLY